MTIEEDIINWALDRPAWQQEVLVALANGEEYDDKKISDLADRLLDTDCSAPSKDAKGIALKSSAIQQVQLASLSGLKDVNALVDGQKLTFASSGLTVVYGDNGSGKSGYARLIKAMVGARHTAEILPNVFSEPAGTPAAELEYTVDGTVGVQPYSTLPTAEVRKMSFYDEHCGDEYLSKQSTISYRPSALSLLDGLIHICDLLRANIQDRINSNQARVLALNIPPQTTAGAFLAGVTAKMTEQQIDLATKLNAGVNEELADALREEARLTTTDASKEQVRLRALSKQFSQLKIHLDGLLVHVADGRVAAAAQLKDRAADLRAAAAIAATSSFDTEPLPGVGSGTWRSLWEAARLYSVGPAYHNHEFPFVDEGAHCPLCQQSIGEEAAKRLQRFSTFMSDTTERDAKAAEGAWGTALQTFKDLVVTTGSAGAAVAVLTDYDPQLGNATRALIEKIEEQRVGILAHLETGSPAPSALPGIDLPSKIQDLADDLSTRAENTDVAKFQTDLTATTKLKSELQATIRLSESASMVKLEVVRLRQLDDLKAAKTAADTSSITQKTSSLTREYASALILDQFTRETERLKLTKVTLEDLGGSKGQLNQRPGLLGSKHKSATSRVVLSEGEQTALGLAGFFTEAMFDESKSALVLDDPVTSLDHVRREYVAARLAQLAKDRQVVVFTHDISFVGDLSTAADSEKVTLAQRSIERRGNTQPGHCSTAYPWKAKDFKSRVDELTTTLQKIEKERPDLMESEYESRTAAWAGLLSETWERSVSTEILNKVFDRGSSQARPQSFRLLAKITDADDTDFQEGYGHTSKWARRHDKAPTTNYVAPEIDEMRKELQRIVDWQKRISKYNA